MAKFDDHYAALQLDYGATQEQIKQRHRKLAVKYHPDRQAKNLDDATRARYKERLAKVNEAWTVFQDEGRKAEYDKLWERQARRPSSSEAEDIGNQFRTQASPTGGSRPGFARSAQPASSGASATRPSSAGGSGFGSVPPQRPGAFRGPAAQQSDAGRGTASLVGVFARRLAALAGAVLFTACPFGIMYLASRGSTHGTNTAEAVLGIPCAVWFLIGLFFTGSAVFGLFTRGPES